jgi:hypothetical protein
MILSNFENRWTTTQEELEKNTKLESVIASNHQSYMSFGYAQPHPNYPVMWKVNPRNIIGGCHIADLLWVAVVWVLRQMLSFWLVAVITANDSFHYSWWFKTEFKWKGQKIHNYITHTHTPLWKALLPILTKAELTTSCDRYLHK